MSIIIGDYFKPWRRKMGVVTLLVACVFAAGWVRSSIMFDGFEVISAKSKYDLSSSRGNICWGYGHSEQARVTKQETRFLSWKLQTIEQSDDDEWETWFVGKHTFLIAGDFHYVSGNQRWGHYTFLAQTPGPAVLVDTINVQVPYWSIVIPLTLLSAYLLLIKPRSKPKRPAETS